MIRGETDFGLTPEDLAVPGKTGPGSGRRTTKTTSAFGRHQRSVPVRPGERDFQLAPDATLRAAVRRWGGGPEDSFLDILPDDLHRRVRMSRSGRLVLLVVDTSESMGAGAAERIKAAKGTVLTLLRVAHHQRDMVGLITFRDQGARVVVPPTRSMELARSHLQRLPVGGATPLPKALFTAWKTLRQEQVKNPLLRPFLVLLTDGDANVPLAPGRSVEKDLEKTARLIRADRIPVLLVHTDAGKNRGEKMRSLAAKMRGVYRQARRIRSVDLTALLLNPVEKQMEPGE